MDAQTMTSVYPNPANDYFVIKIDLGKTGDQGILTLRDGTGRLIRSHPFYGQQDQLVWSTSELKSGMYLLSLTISGKQSDCVKITVVK